MSLPALPNLDYGDALDTEQKLLTSVDVPIVTVSATTRAYLETIYGDVFPPTPEVVFSRAHYSMALGCLLAAYQAHNSAWLVDPTNYVSAADWPKVLMTENIAKLVARHELLKDLKNLVENFTRSKLPISDAIETPLLTLFQNVSQPILSLHYEAGNKLVKAGKRVVQIVTDPHIRPQYLDCLPSTTTPEVKVAPTSGVKFCVFDNSTKNDLLKLANELCKLITTDQVIVTGPPVDPRIVACRQKYTTPEVKAAPTSGVNYLEPLKLAIITGGIGTNYGEIKALLSQFKTEDFSGQSSLQLILYAGLHKDFQELYTNFAHKLNLNVGNLDNPSSPVRIIHETSLVEANEHLVNYVFPWADAIITKPSGDMAYDAAAAAIPCLFLDPLGPWEENIQTRFLALGIGHDLDVNAWSVELAHLLLPQGCFSDFFTAARSRCLTLPDYYTHGCQNILTVVLR